MRERLPPRSTAASSSRSRTAWCRFPNRCRTSSPQPSTSSCRLSRLPLAAKRRRPDLRARSAIAHDDAAIALPLGRKRVVDRPERAAEFGERVEIPVGRLHALGAASSPKEALPEEPHEEPVPVIEAPELTVGSPTGKATQEY